MQPIPPPGPTPAIAPTPPGTCPQFGPHYLTEVNKGSINMRSWQAHLNEMYRNGYRLCLAFEQHGNTVQVYEHRHPPT